MDFSLVYFANNDTSKPLQPLDVHVGHAVAGIFHARGERLGHFQESLLARALAHLDVR